MLHPIAVPMSNLPKWRKNAFFYRAIRNSPGTGPLKSAFQWPLRAASPCRSSAPKGSKLKGPSLQELATARCTVPGLDPPGDTILPISVDRVYP